jgi:hypothetical protein
MCNADRPGTAEQNLLRNAKVFDQFRRKIDDVKRLTIVGLFDRFRRRMNIIQPMGKYGKIWCFRPSAPYIVHQPAATKQQGAKHTVC